MPILPTYIDQGTLSSGGDTLRLNRKEDSGGAALAHLGSQLGAYAVAEANTDAKIAAKAEAEQKKTDALSDSLVLEDMQTQWHQKQAQIETNIDPSGQGHFDNIQQAWQEHVEQ